jgi:carbon-monoxide dehydrogenase large subunit
MAAKQLVGQPMKRTEDPRLITGTSHYVDDIKLPEMHYVAILRSIYAHARIKSIDVQAAKHAPDVVAVVTGEDVQGKIGPVPCASALEGLKTPPHPVLAVGKVCYVGEPVVAVVATDRYAARDALDLINIDYEPLDAVVDPEKALEPGAPVIHEQFGDNQAYVMKFAGGSSIDEAFQNADKIVSQPMVNQRLIPVAMEPRGALAQYLPGENQLTLWSSTQIPHLLRTQIALMIGLPENRVRVITPEVGGGFGSKLNVYGEEALVAYLSMQLKKPVKWAETRRENFLNTIHGRAQVNYVDVAVKNDGTILGLKVKIIGDLGACFQLLTPAIPTLSGLMLSGPYRIPAITYEIIGAFTNTMATDAYRGAGRPEATYLLERMMDRIAGELGLDPAEVRRKNFPRPDEFPFATATGLAYDSGNYEAPLNKALEMAGYSQLRQEQKQRRAQGEYVGIGLSSYVEICALGPSAAMPAGGWESATVRVEPTGKVTVLTGASPHGQGQETSFAQIVADELGVPVEDILVIHGDTGVVQYGIGTFGSRATAVGGTAVYNALQTVKQKAAKFAAHLLQVDPSQLAFADGKFTVKGDSSKTLSLQEIALAAYTAKSLPPNTEPGLEATNFFEPSNFTFPFGTHVVVVEIDKETGEPKITKYVAVDDCGKVINPLLVHGQIHGGIAQSIGQAFLEEAVYDEYGQLVTGELTDYAIPKAHDVPWLELDRTETPSPVNPLGIKGVGEAGTIGATPAIVNAVVDALSPLGVTHIDMPLKAEKLWKILGSTNP